MNIIFLTNKFFPENNPQAILLRNLLVKLSKYKSLNIHLLTTSNKCEKIENIYYKFFSLKINKYWKFFDKIPFCNKFLFARFKYAKQLKFFKKYSQSNKIDYIVSFSNPYILNVLAHFLSIDLNIKNIIHYSDPVYKTVYKKSFLFFFRDFALKILEKTILLNSSHIVVNNYQMAEFIYKNHNSNFFYKTSIIPHSYDKNHYFHKINKNTKIKSKSIIFSFFGSLNIIRNPLLLIKAIIELKEKKIILDTVNFFFYGNIDKYLKTKLSFIKDILKKNNIYFCRPISFVESIVKMFKSDILVSFDAPNNEKIYLTSKNIFYLPTNKLVLNITQKQSPNYFFGLKAGYLFANVLDYKDVKKKITIALINYKKFKSNKTIIKTYSSNVIAHKWYNLFCKLNMKKN